MQPEPNHVGALEKSIRREAESCARPIVRIKRLSTRFLDPDNLVGSVKLLLDCLRNCGLIADDDSRSIVLEVTQEKVKTRKEHATHVEIEYPEDVK